MLSLAKIIEHNTAGLKQNITEVIGDIALDRGEKAYDFRDVPLEEE